MIYANVQSRAFSENNLTKECSMYFHQLHMKHINPKLLAGKTI